MTKRTKIALIIAGVVIAALVAVIVVLVINGGRKGGVGEAVSETPEKRNKVVTEENAEEVAEEMVSREYIEPGYYNAQMTNVWHFRSGDAESEDAYVANAEGNTNDVYFDVVMADNEEEVILASPVIPRGAELENIKLDKDLDPGTYDCVMIYHLVDEEQNTVSTLRVGLTVIVEG